MRQAFEALEVRITRVRVAGAIRLDGHHYRIAPDRWRSLIMSFQQFYALGDRVRPATPTQIPEEACRPRSLVSPNVVQAV